jgi:hypothetical protein
VPTHTARVIRVDVVGDPLFRRRLCQPQSLFATPRPVRSILFRDANGFEFQTEPDAVGNVLLTGNNFLAPATVLRVATVPGGVKIGAVGADPAV